MMIVENAVGLLAIAGSAIVRLMIAEDVVTMTEIVAGIIIVGVVIVVAVAIGGVEVAVAPAIMIAIAEGGIGRRVVVVAVTVVRGDASSGRQIRIDSQA